MTEFIGKGEKTATKILEMVTGLPEHLSYTHERPGIYTQVKVKDLYFKVVYDQLSPEQQKGSIDIVVVTRKKWMLLFRVQGKGHIGLHKAKSDAVQKFYLGYFVAKKVWIVDLNIWECIELFKERINFMSMFEVFDAMRRAGVKPEMI